MHLKPQEKKKKKKQHIEVPCAFSKKEENWNWNEFGMELGRKIFLELKLHLILLCMAGSA